MKHIIKGEDGLIARLTRIFPDREIYVRSGGHMRFLKISSRFQIRAAAALAFIILAWLMVTAVMIGFQLQTAQDRVALGAQQEKVSRTAGKVQAYRSSVDGMADRLEARQEQLDTMVENYFGDIPAAAPAAGKGGAGREAAVQPAPGAAPQKIGLAIPGAAPLAAIEQRQLAFAATLSAAATDRAKQAEQAIRRYGLNPQSLAGARGGMGGPFIPASRPRSGSKDPHLAQLAVSLQQLDRMERTLVALPNGAPASPLTFSSGFGYRADPFTGAGALHAGMDVSGTRGQPIFAASAGRIIFVGQQNGYGNLVVVDHGHGLETRYGHLSGFTARVGDRVARGQQIARMGSTGRSTGNHLHFEVRVGGRAINPRPFLEADADVLKVQERARRRFGVSGRG